jgi:S-adenosyl-L-methionine hydrolase (adenosine-forming)
MKERDIVTFLSDYGLEDEFVGVCHGVMLRIAPRIRIVDLHHNVLRQNIRHGAIVLQQSIRFMPDSVHLAVVDPSVGSNRHPIVIETGGDAVLVGPDNGLLLPAAETLGGIRHAYVISNERFLLSPVSRTFQGRDVFAPTAAHVANGIDLAEFGPPIEADDLVRLEIPEAWEHEDHLHAEVLQVDRFGNLQFNVRREHLDKVGLEQGHRAEVRVEGHRLNVAMCQTFSDVATGVFVLIEDSYTYLSLAVNNGDAARRLRASAGSTAIIGPASIA